MSADSGQLVVFSSGDLLCALGIELVQEINKDMEITPVHLVPDYVRGVINLRGQIVTVIDLRKKLRLPPADASGHSRIVILRWNHEPVGLLVDSVSDILSPPAEDLLAVPSNVNLEIRDFFRSVYRTEDSLISVLDADALLGQPTVAEGPVA